MSSQLNKSKKESLNEQEDLPEILSKIVNLNQEKDQHIIRLAEDEKVAMIAFIAPYVSVRISPIEEKTAFIGLPDEFGVEALIKELQNAGIKNAYFLVNSPGGAFGSSYKIARAIRSTFTKIITFIPHVAASGGTLLALTGNEIVMGPMSHLTPLDVQIPYKDSSISAAKFMRFFSRSSKWFETRGPEEAPYPLKALADKLDPILMEEWSGLLDTAIDYVSDILKLAGYKNEAEIAQKLVMAFSSHNYVINYDRARDIGLKVKKEEDFKGTWDVMRYWLSKYMFEQKMTHCILYALPSKSKKNQTIIKKDSQNELGK